MQHGARSAMRITPAGRRSRNALRRLGHQPDTLYPHLSYGARVAASAIVSGALGLCRLPDSAVSEGAERSIN